MVIKLYFSERTHKHTGKALTHFQMSFKHKNIFPIKKVRKKLWKITFKYNKKDMIVKKRRKNVFSYFAIKI